MDTADKIKAINDLAIAWYSTSQADFIHEAIFRGQGLGKFADHCKEEGEEELEEAKRCTARVIELGGTPTFGFDPQPIFDDVKDVLGYWRKQFLEDDAIGTMNKLAASLADDAVTRKMIEDFVAGEEEHCAWVCKHLAIIDKLGYDNYLLEMMDI